VLPSFLWSFTASHEAWSVQLRGYLDWLDLGGLMTFLIALAAVKAQPRLLMLSNRRWEANPLKAANLAA
jgi:hypothetical protein